MSNTVVKGSVSIFIVEVQVVSWITYAGPSSGSLMEPTKDS